MKSIVVTYKNGNTISIDIPDSYYPERFSKKSQEKSNKTFKKDYKKFLDAISKCDGMLDVSNYLKCSNASICTRDILSIDIKDVDPNAVNVDVAIPALKQKVYLDITDTKLQAVLEKIESTNIIEDFATFLKKVRSIMNKNNVEVVIKAGVKKKSSTAKTKTTDKLAEENNLEV